MAVTEQGRHHLHLRLDQVLGSEEATTLMEHLPPVGWADVATKSDLASLQDSLTGRIDRLELATDARFALVDQRFDVMDLRFDQIDQRFGETDRRFDQIDQRFGETDRRFDQIDQRFEAMDRRFEAMDRRFEAIDRRFARIDDRLAQIDRQIAQIAATLDALVGQVQGLAKAPKEMDDRWHATLRTMITMQVTLYAVACTIIGVLMAINR